MTDQPERYIDPYGYTLKIESRPSHDFVPCLHLAISPNLTNFAKLPVPVTIPTFELLVMIDRLDPDVMRAYLRENTEGWCDCGGQTTAREVPESDSPEDVDETPDPVEQMRESGRQLGEAWRALSDAFREAASKGSDR